MDHLEERHQRLDDLIRRSPNPRSVEAYVLGYLMGYVPEETWEQCLRAYEASHDLEPVTSSG